MAGLRGQRRCSAATLRTVLAALPAACATDTTGPDAPVATLEISPASAVVLVAATVQLAVILRDSTGNPLTGRHVAWSTSDPRVLTVSDDGLATGVTPGRATVTASSGGRSASAAITVAPGQAVRLDFTVPPGSAAAGEVISPAIEVTAWDSRGHRATGFAGNVTLAIGTNPAGATLTGTTTVVAVDGVARFSNVSIDKSGAGYTLHAAAEGLEGAASAAFEIHPGPATRLALTTQPTTAGAGHPIAPAVVVTALDELGNTAAAFTADITITLGENPGGATLGGTTTVAAVGGVATFANLRINRTGSGYTLVVSSATVPGDTSATFDVIHAAAARLAFTAQPPTAMAGSAITPAVVVATLDSLGNVATEFTGEVTVALGVNPGGAVLSGTTTVAVTAGVATFADLRVDRAGGGYTLVASTAVISPDTSEAFDVDAGPAARLVFTTQPATVPAGSPVAPAIVVTAEDAQGNTATSFAGSVTVVLDANPGGTTLLGTTTVAATAGVATFADLRLAHAGTGYSLVASSSGLVPATSTAFDVVAATAARLVFTRQPTSTIAGSPIAPAVVVGLRDTLGNPVTTFDGIVTVALGAGSAGARLSGTDAVAAVDGVATFADLRLDNVGTGYTLIATSPSLDGAVSASFGVTAAAPAALAFTVQPGPAVAGDALAPAVRVAARDAFGNAATSFDGEVTIALEHNPGAATLSGTRTVTATSGSATFSDLALDKVGNGYTLAASAGNLAGVISGSFSVSAAAAVELAFTVQPSHAVAGTAIAPAIEVRARDRFGNTADSFAGDIAVTLVTAPGGGTLGGNTTRPAAGGVASFADLRMDGAGTGYTLAASAAAMSPDTSQSFDVAAGPAARIAFTGVPAMTEAGSPLTPAVVVTVLDAWGNTATSFTGMVEVALGNNPGGATLAGPTGAAATQGMATFAGLSLEKVGTGYTLVASGPGVSADTSPEFTVLAGPAVHLDFATQPPTAVAGRPFSPAVAVAALDRFGNTATGFTGDVAVALDANPGGATLHGTTTVAAVDGVATFTDLTLDRTGGGYTLLATGPGMPSVVSAAFEVHAAAAGTLVFTTQPVGAQAGSVIVPGVVVTARDSLGNTATAFTGDVTIALGAAPAGATLSGRTVAAATAGVATFAELRVDRAGVAYTLVASAADLSAAASAAFDIIAGPAAQLVFSTQPGTASAGSAIGPPVRVTARDSLGNATSLNGTITIALGDNPGGATLSGTTSAVVDGGVATFADLRLDRAGAGYTLVATGAGLTTTSVAFEVSAGAPARLVFATQPANATAGAPIVPAVAVAVQDTLGNTATSFEGTVTVALGDNPGGATLTGATAAIVGGVATFTDLRIDKAGTAYTLVVTDTALAGETSAGFSVTAASAIELLFSVQPAGTVAGAAITPAVRVTARDGFGNTATSFAGDVTVALDSNPGGAVLGGTTTVTAEAGVATFATLVLDKAGSGYRLAAAASGVAATASTEFTVAAAAGTALSFTVEPSATAAGAPIAPAVQVAVRDGFGNIATSFSGDVSIALESNPAGASLGGTTTVAAVEGFATFPDLTLDRIGSGYALAASAAGRTGVTSASFSVTAAPATALVLTVHPGNTVAGAAITPAVEVTARDAFGNTATSFTGDVTIALDSNPGGAVLSGTTTVTAAAGVATFATLVLDKAGSGYRLAAAASGVATTASAEFTVAAAAGTALSFTVEPSATAIGAPIGPAVQVAARDQFGNIAMSFSGDVSIALEGNPGGASLGGTTTVAALAGVATFPDLTLDRMGSGYTLTASAAGLSGATSAAFSITAAPATALVFTVQPGNTVAGVVVTPAVQVTALDAFGDTATSFTGDVTVALGANPGGATLGGTTTVAAVAGVATFSDLTLDKAGNGYSLAASAPGPSGASSVSFDVRAAAATALLFTVNPTTTVAGAAITPAVQVTALDDFGNAATSFTGSVTVALANNPGGATLSGTKTSTAVAGAATFSGLSLNKAGTGYALTASTSGLTGALSAPFAITAGSATALAFTVKPSNAVVGAAITPPVQVTALDSFGNRADAFMGNVTIALSSNPTGATLSGTKTVAAVAGVATFANLSLNKAGTGYKLRATASGLSRATSTSFSVSGMVLVGAGDIATCGGGAAATAALLDNISGTVFTTGDNAYPDGTAMDFAECYDPTWGRHKARTRPSPGNHDYHTSGAADYYSYFGANAGPAGRGYYSYNLGDWHIISLNSNVSMSAGSAQEQWLRADLAASSKRCTLAYWHHARFSSGSHGSSAASQPLWQALYNAGAEIVLVGHDHNYQRFAPMTATGTLDLARGIRQFVVGTGGAGHYSFSTPIANTEAYNTTAWGVLKLTLSANSYTWEFIPVAGGTYRDSGSGTCH